jgi:hypothetical protein
VIIKKAKPEIPNCYIPCKNRRIGYPTVGPDVERIPIVI